MSDEVRDLLVRGVAAARANEKDQARFYLEWVLRREDKDREQAVDALLWLSQLADNPADKRECLENILVLDPAHPLARRGMAILDGRLKPQDVMNPDQPVQPVKPDATPAALNVRRYICPKCGGKMAYDAKRRSLSSMQPAGSKSSPFVPMTWTGKQLRPGLAASICRSGLLTSAAN